MTRKAGGIVALVLDLAGEDVEAVDLSGEFGGERGHLGVSGLGHLAGRARGVGAGDALDVVLCQECAALAQKHRMAFGALDLFQRHAGQGQQVDMHAHESLGNDVQAGVGKQVVNVGHAPESGVFDRQHGKVRLARADGLDRVLEGAAGQGIHVGIGVAAGLVGIGAGLSLKGDAFGHVVGSSPDFYHFPLNFAEGGRLVAETTPCAARGEADRYRARDSDGSGLCLTQ